MANPCSLDLIPSMSVSQVYIYYYPGEDWRISSNWDKKESSSHPNYFITCPLLLVVLYGWEILLMLDLPKPSSWTESNCSFSDASEFFGGISQIKPRGRACFVLFLTCKDMPLNKNQVFFCLLHPVQALYDFSSFLFRPQLKLTFVFAPAHNFFCR